jgi:hypothetical protein
MSGVYNRDDNGYPNLVNTYDMRLIQESSDYLLKTDANKCVYLQSLKFIVENHPDVLNYLTAFEKEESDFFGTLRTVSEQPNA